jgi:two-component system nitrogen regulation sensor histidine kinase NtrY
MTFRRKLLLVFALTVFFSVLAVTMLVSAVARRAFDRSEDERTTALVTQFRREFNHQGEEVVRRVEAVANSESAIRMAAALNRKPSDAGPYFESAKSAGENNRLDFLEFVESDGNIVSSEQWSDRFGYPDATLDSFPADIQRGAFLKLEALQDASALGLFAVRAISGGEHPVYVVGGRRLDKSFLAALDMPSGMRALLYQNRGDRFSPDLLIDPSAALAGSAESTEKLRGLIDEVRRSTQEEAAIVHWSADPAEDEIFHAIPLMGVGAGKDKDKDKDKDQPLLAILLIGNSRRSYVELMRRIRSAALIVGGGGIFFAILLSSWVAARVTRPVEQLAHAAQEIGAGNWNVHVSVPGHDEISQLAESFNQMTAELLDQRERLLQAERVAAWRELARRLAHELKNPLFPLQLTMENLIRARQQSQEQFDEIFRESSTTLLAEISNLKAIISRFSDFAKMPQPQLQRVEVNEVVRGVAQLFQAQLQAPGRASIQCHLQLDPKAGLVSADVDLLHRAISNLVLNAVDAMPAGGKLTLSTQSNDGNVLIHVADTGDGLTPEECERIFTPYYTSKTHGTGLGLAIVQSVVSDHGGRIRVYSTAGHGTTFVIELPARANNNGARPTEFGSTQVRSTEIRPTEPI